MPSVKTRNLYNAVVLSIGRRAGFKANSSVAIDDVVADVLELSGFGDAEILELGQSLAKAGEDPMDVGRKDLRRKVHFAHRNQRAASKGSKSTSYCKTPLTVLVKAGQWALTEFGAITARRMDEGIWTVTTATKAASAPAPAAVAAPAP